MRCVHVLLAISLATVVAAATASATAATPRAVTAAVSPAVSLAVAVPPAASHAAGTYVPIAPFRAVDTRKGTLGNRKGAVLHNSGIVASVGGHGGVPIGAAAVALTITALAPTASGALIAYASGTRRPGVSNVRYSKGRNAAVAAMVRMSRSGRVDFFNVAAAGNTQIAVDVAGYFVGGAPSPSDAGVFHSVTPTRVLTTGAGTHAVRSGRAVTATVAGRSGVPAAGVGAVAVMISAVRPTRAGSLVAYAAGGARPGRPTLHFAAGVSYAGFAVVPTDGHGRITVYNASAGSVQIVVDLVGWTVGGTVKTVGTMQPRGPSRLVNNARIAANTSLSVPVVARAGVPAENVSAVIVTITVAASRANGGIVAWAGATSAPGVTNLQYSRGQTVSDVALVPVSSTGRIAVRNVSSGSAALTLDVSGYVPSTPATSTGRYVRNITAVGGSDVTTMTNEGCADAIGSKLVLLELGAQTVTAPLSTDQPGVLLTARSDPQYRLSYARVRNVLTGYLGGFHGCANGATATIALGTSNDGDYTGPYSATQRGTDWASEVVAPMRALALALYPGVTVVGADDIEPGFAATPEQTAAWETAYLSVDNTNDEVGTLIFNGSADGCPTTPGLTDTSCGNGWTQQQLYDLMHVGSRIEALPQVYDAGQAVKWANIDATGGGGIVFAGALTEYAACPAASADCPEASLRPSEGWTALQQAIATVVGTPNIPAATDLQVDS